MKRALICLLSVSGVLLVSSCASERPYVAPSVSGTFKAVKYEDHGRALGSIYTTCLGDDKVFMYDRGVAVIQNHKECRNG